jgi:hypothetical protein
MVYTPASYSGGPGFKSPSRDRTHLVFVVFLEENVGTAPHHLGLQWIRVYWFVKDVEGSDPDLIWGTVPKFPSSVWRKPRNIYRDSRYPSRDWNRAPPKYKSEANTNLPIPVTSSSRSPHPINTLTLFSRVHGFPCNCFPRGLPTKFLHACPPF